MRRYGVRPRKKSGQTFLTDPVVAKQIVDAAELRSQDLSLIHISEPTRPY